MSNSKLHIYSPLCSHDHAFIVGNREALEALRDAIEDALEIGQNTGAITASTADGEGFELKVYREEENTYWDKALLPYTDQSFPSSEKPINPWDLFKKRK